MRPSWCTFWCVCCAGGVKLSDTEYSVYSIKMAQNHMKEIDSSTLFEMHCIGPCVSSYVFNLLSAIVIMAEALHHVPHEGKQLQLLQCLTNLCLNLSFESSLEASLAGDPSYGETHRQHIACCRDICWPEMAAFSRGSGARITS